MTSEEHQNLRTQLARLRGQIKEYYATYFSELRSELGRNDLFFNAIPDHLRGYKRVISIGGRDGLIVVQFPAELEITISKTDTGELLIHFPSVLDAQENIFEFVTFPNSPVKDLVRFVNDGEDINDVMPSDTQWGIGVAGVFDRPAQKADLDTGQVTWRAPWTRLSFADFNHLHFWADKNRARWEAKKDIEPYVKGIERKELDDVIAPEDVKEASVKAGDRGVVIEEFKKPDPALLVEFADPVGQTKALITYSTNLDRIIDVFVDEDFLKHRGKPLDQEEAPREQIHEVSSSPPVLVEAY